MGEGMSYAKLMLDYVAEQNRRVKAESSLIEVANECHKLRAQVEALSKCCTQRGARMQIMREWMDSNRGIGPPTEWWYFVEERPEAAKWFDADGVPVREGE